MSNRLCLRALGALGVAALTLPAVAGVAFAKEEDSGEGKANPFPEAFGFPKAVPPPAGLGALTIHKHDTRGLEGAGKSGAQLTGTTADAPTKGTPLEGIPFTVTALCVVENDEETPYTDSFDPQDPENWQWIATLPEQADKLAKYTVADEENVARDNEDYPWQKCVNPDNGYTVTGKTDDKGEYKVENLEPGVYLVEEGVSDTVTVAAQAAPFVVTLPMPNEDYSKWNKDIHAYVKNTKILDPMKQIVVDPAAPKLPEVLNTGNTGSAAEKYTVKWRLTATVPRRTDPAHAWEYLKLVDSSSGAGTADLKMDQLTITTAKIGEKNLTADDYDLTPQSDGFTLAVKQPVLANVNTGEDILVEYTTPFEPSAAGGVENTFKLLAKADSEPEVTATIPDPKLVPGIKYGRVQIVKQDAEDLNKKLKGAVFEICAADEKHEGCAPGAKSTALRATDSRGEVSAIVNLGETTEEDATTPATAKWFCIVEKEAPVGYRLDKTPHCFEVTDQHTETKPLGVTVNNRVLPPFKPELPLTGANGFVLLVALGGSVIALATGAALVGRRRQSLAS